MRFKFGFPSMNRIKLILGIYTIGIALIHQLPIRANETPDNSLDMENKKTGESRPPIQSKNISIRITDNLGNPLDEVMVTIRPKTMALAPTEDNGYPESGKPFYLSEEKTGFTKNGNLNVQYPIFPSSNPLSQSDDLVLRAQKIGYSEIKWKPVIGNRFQAVMEPVTNPNILITQYPSNAWVAALDWGEDKELRTTYMEQCGFCHQQGSAPMRRERSEDEWRETMNRMIGYGSRPHKEAQKALPALLSKMYADLLEHPERVKPGFSWGQIVHRTTIREWQMGDEFSQMHDMLAHSNGKVYVGDNLQDRIWEIDPKTSKTIVHKIPKRESDNSGGLISGRLSTFPKHETYVGVHSLAESPKDGNIFLTPSLVRRLIEFNPNTGEFIEHEFEGGLYPHTIRIDKEDRVWFTLALSNQIGMFDRNTTSFRIYDLPPRSGKEAFNLWISGFIRVLMNWGFPMHWLPVDERVTGMPLPYGIDTSPDGRVWFARLHADTIGYVDPRDADNHKVEIIPTPFQGPRRLRTDNEGNVWIGAFPEASVYRYTPHDGEFQKFPMPTAVDGVETPYSLNVNRITNQVWVTGTQSDSLAILDIASLEWEIIPLPRKVSFSRDIDFSSDGKFAYTSNGAFPSWHIEDKRPTLVEVEVR